MATAFSTLLKIALPTQGELSGSWGDVVNNNITSMVEEAIAGLKTINTWSGNSATLSTANGTTAESRAAMLLLTDTTSDLSGAATLICPALSKIFIVKNGAGQTVTVKTASGSGIAVSNGNTSILFCDGTNVVEAVTGITGNLDVGGNLTVGGNATVTGTTTFNGGTLTLGDSAADNVVFGADVNSSIIPNTDDTYDLGSASQEWRNLHLDGTANIDTLVADEATIDSININGKVITMTGDTSDTAVFTAGTNGTLTIVTTDAAGAAANITITADGTAELAGTTVTLNSGGDIVLDADGANIVFKDGGTSILDIANNSTDVELTVSTADKNFAIKGTDGSSAITALDIDMALAGKATFSGDVVVTGDLTVSGDDITMATNNAGNLLIADGTNFNSVAVSSLSALSTAEGTDTLLIVDATDNSLKKVTRSVLIDGLATSDANNIVNDSTPQLGGDLDAQGKDLEDVGISSADSHAGIYGSSSAPVILTVTVTSKTAAHPYNGDGSSSAYFINGVEAPALTLHGVDNVTSDSGYYYKFDQANSSNNGHPLRFYLDANKTTAYTTGVTTSGTPGNAGAYTQIDVDEDTPSILYYQCSSHEYMGNHAIVLGSNKINHSDALISFPTATTTLVGTNTTDTLTNKTLTSPKINEDVVLAATATELNILDGATVIVDEINALDLGSTAVGTAIASKAVILDSNKDYTGIRNFTVTGEVIGTGFTGTLDGVLGSGTAAAATTTTLAATTGTFSGVLKTDDTTDATSTTDGSLQTDGGLSVAKDAVIGDDLLLLSDASVIKFGANSEVTLTHVHNAGLILGGTAPSLTIGDAGEEDTKLVFDGAAQDFYVGLDDSADDLVIGKGSAVGTTPALSIDENLLVTVSDDVFVTGRASGTATTNTNGQMDLAVSNHFNYTPSGDDEIELDNLKGGQTGTIFLDNSGGHQLSVDSTIAINADVLSAISTAGKYMLSYYCTVDQANATLSNSANNDLILMSATGALT